MVPFVHNGGKDLPSLGVAAAIRAMGVSPDEVSIEGDVLRIRDRRVPLVPVRVKSGQSDRSMDDADRLSRAGADPPSSGQLERPYATYNSGTCLRPNSGC
jgi:hypothetical protein